jgi:hypothetical protein
MSKKIGDLRDYTWGLGIEHEMHIFHKPKPQNKSIKDYILFDSYSAVERLLNQKNNISYDDYEFLKNIPFEVSGRTCNQQWVIKPVPVKMPEFITSFPFCSLKNGRSLLNMTREISLSRERFYELLLLDKQSKNLMKKYGDFREYPFGMTRYLKCPLRVKDNRYLFKKNEILPEYNGSYHITFTLPYTEKTTNREFLKMHQNFANQLQWLEPLMLSAYFTGDEYAPGTLKQRVRGSFRVMIIGWGNFAGSDVRLFKQGIGRYSKTPTYWRKNLRFIDSNKLKPCYKPSPMALKEKAITSLSSDFRTFGSPDPMRPMHRESGIGMNKPNGVEFRIFDHFQDAYLENLLMLVSLVAENSRVHQTKGYVYQNKVWIHELHNIMKNGFKAHISKKYINLLRKKLGLKIDTESIIAQDIFKVIYDELWEKNINGEWSKIFHNNTPPKYDLIPMPEINRNGWQFAFITKLNNESKLLDKFNFLSKEMSKLKSVSFRDFKRGVIQIFGKNWRDDVENIAYFYSTLSLTKYVKLVKNKDGTIKSLDILNKIPIYKNFNDLIMQYFGNDRILINKNIYSSYI